jgi:hypothetical protein
MTNLFGNSTGSDNDQSVIIKGPVLEHLAAMVAGEGRYDNKFPGRNNAETIQFFTDLGFHASGFSSPRDMAEKTLRQLATPTGLAGLGPPSLTDRLEKAIVYTVDPSHFIGWSEGYDLAVEMMNEVLAANALQFGHNRTWTSIWL